MISRRNLLVAAVAMGVALSARAGVDEAKNLIGPSVYDWTKIAAQKTEVGEMRSFFR